MANKRYLPCKEKEVYAIGQENSINDLKEKMLACFSCYKFIDCKNSQIILNKIKDQQNSLIFLKKGFNND